MGQLTNIALAFTVNIMLVINDLFAIKSAAVFGLVFFQVNRSTRTSLVYTSIMGILEYHGYSRTSWVWSNIIGIVERRGYT